MLKKIILLLLISSIAVCCFAQKSKRKAIAKSPKNTYFEMLINGSVTPRDNYCPDSTIVFTFRQIDSSFTDFSFCWYDQYSSVRDSINDTLRLAFPLLTGETYSNHPVFLYLKIQTGDTLIKDTLKAIIRVGLDQYIIYVKVCMGRDTTIQTKDHGDIIFTDIKGGEETEWDTYQNIYGCDSLVRWVIEAKDYERKEYSISSCDTVIWGEDTIFRNPPDLKRDSTYMIERIFEAKDRRPCCDCDTIKTLKATIIYEKKLSIKFEQSEFCAKDDMKGTLNLEGTNFTAVYWLYKDTDFDTTLFGTTTYEIEEPGYYYVRAYMDTSLYDTLKDLRIVNHSACTKSDERLVTDCPLIIPNIITPNGDAKNES
jgi:hypothetical protein